MDNHYKKYNFLYYIYYRLTRFLGTRKRNFYVGYNKWLFSRYGIKFGESMEVYNRLYLECEGNVTIGDGFKFTSGDGINPMCRNFRGSIHVLKESNIMIGDNVGISSSCLWAEKEIKIGNNVKIGANCIIMDTDGHSTDFIKRRTFQGYDTINTAPVKIQDDVWIGANSLILKGVTIGARSIIGAGSIVTSSIPSDCIAVGVPAHVVREINRK